MSYGKKARERLAVDRDAAGLPKNPRSSTAKEDEPHRPPFAHDTDRLIDTAGFRRLQGKMQVVSPGQGDFFRTRLTHTIEVSRLARSIAYKLGRNESAKTALKTALICEAAGVAHDFGHPPFGHGGETALNRALDKIAHQWGIDLYQFGGFEGNAQSFRQIVWSFSRSQEDPGLHLTRAVLDAVLKYPWKRSPWDVPKTHKWGYYPTEQWAFDWVRNGIEDKDQSYEAQIMDWADDVAYATHDLEDWFQAGLLPLNLLRKSPKARKQLAGEIQKCQPQKASKLDVFNRIFEEEKFFDAFRTFEGEYDGSAKAKYAIRNSRRKLFRYLVNSVKVEGDVGMGLHNAKLLVPDEVRQVTEAIKELTDFYVLKRPSMATYEYGQGRIVEFLMETYASLVKSNDRLTTRAVSPADREAIEKLRKASDRAAGEQEILRMIVDQVAGMTDAYAGMMFNRLSGEENATHLIHF